MMNDEIGLNHAGEVFRDSHWISNDGTGEVSPLFIRDIQIPEEMEEAEILISGLGYYRLYINGKRVGDSELDPGQTDYEKRVFYQVYDVRPYLTEGLNRVGVQLGNGWYGQDRVWGEFCHYGSPRLCVEIRLIDHENHIKTIHTDENWLTGASALLENNIYAGELFDARCFDPRWCEPGYGEGTWQPAQIVPSPGGRMELQSIPPIRKIEYCSPISSFEPEDGIFVYDFGQNMAGWAALEVTAAKGTVITMRFGEDLDRNGRVDTGSTGVYATGVEQIDRYICSGNGRESWEPAFTYHGFRYVEVSVEGPMPTMDTLSLTAYRLATDLRDESHFSTRIPQVNTAWDLVQKAIESNIHSVLTDCPARERCGWLGDAHLVAETLMYGYDAKAFLKKFLDDVETTRDGGIPWDITPGKRRCLRGCPDWIAAAVLVPWYLYEFSGDISILSEHHDCMKQVVSYVHGLSVDGIITEGRGDWCPPGTMVDPEKTPPPVQNTLIFAYTARIMQEVVTLLDITGTTPYAQWADQAIAACIRDYYHPDRGFSSQCLDAMAIDMGLFSGDVLERITDDLIHRTLDNGKICFEVGAFGAKHLFPALSKIGRDDLIYRIITKEDYPGYLDIIRQGATTLWENWEKIRPDAPECVKRSQNHHMHGGFGAWFFKYLAGIQPDRGFSRFILSPHFREEYGGIDCRLEIAEGIIESSWKFHDDTLNWAVRIPEGTLAEIRIPVPDVKEIREKGRRIVHDSPDGQFIHRLGPGRYYFVFDREQIEDV